MEDAPRERLKRVLEEALEQPPPRRESFLRAACEADLLDEALALLPYFAPGEAYFDRLRPDVGLAPGPEVPPEDAEDPLIGRHIPPHYEVREKLGGGGMGVVYKAWHQTLRQYHALKFLPPHLHADDEARDRFMQEARAASALAHENICTIHDIRPTDSGRYYIAMAFYEGETLKKKIGRGPVPLAEALSYGMQVARGLARAHERDIIHRDIKPANVMVTSEGAVKIVDFGVAKQGSAAGDRETAPDSPVGTWAYMSPEQVRCEAVDARTDLWSLGVLLYEMVVGRHPFPAANWLEVLYQVENEDPPALERVCPGVPDDVARIVGKCLEKDRTHRYQTARALYEDLYRAREAQRRRPPAKAPNRAARVYLSYRRGEGFDARMARILGDALGQHHHVFLDDRSHADTRWVKRLETELARADYVVVLLSAAAVHSEMVLAEIETARRLAPGQDGRPVILPVRLAYGAPLVYPLNVYLDAHPCAYWADHADTPALVAAVERVLRGQAGAFPEPDPRPPPPPVAALPEPPAAAQPPAAMEMPEGTMGLHSGFYVARPEDEIALAAVARQGLTLTIKGPRQMGKSSLLIRSMAAAARAGKAVVFLDFQLFEHAALHDAGIFYRQFCSWITDELELEDEVDAYWARPLGNSQRCTRYMGRHLLRTLDRPLFLAMDEVERVFDTPFRSDFFSMLRSWHNDRALKLRWKQLDLALVTSTEPYQLIENLNQSPFNVGEVIALGDFTAEQVTDLNERHGVPLTGPALARLMELLHGHPYLTRRALYLVATGRVGAGSLFAQATDDDGPFGDHLRHHLFRLHGQRDLAEALSGVLHHRACPDEGRFWRLRGAGLVRREGEAVVPRCPLYADYFRGRLYA